MMSFTIPESSPAGRRLLAAIDTPPTRSIRSTLNISNAPQIEIFGGDDVATAVDDVQFHVRIADVFLYRINMSSCGCFDCRLVPSLQADGEEYECHFCCDDCERNILEPALADLFAEIGLIQPEHVH